MLVPVLRSRNFTEAEHYAVMAGGERAAKAVAAYKARTRKARGEERRREQLRIDEISRDLALLEDVFGTPHAKQQALLEEVWGE